MARFSLPGNCWPPGTPPKDVAKDLGVSVPTLYRWIPASGRLSVRYLRFLQLPVGKKLGVKLQAHDARRTCAKLCHAAGGDLEQIQLLLGHSLLPRPTASLRLAHPQFFAKYSGPRFAVCDPPRLPSAVWK